MRALRLRVWAALGLLRVMVVVTARSLAGFLGRPIFLPGPGVRGPPCGLEVSSRRWACSRRLGGFMAGGG